MTHLEIRIESRTFFRACVAGLSEATAVVELSVRGEIPTDSAAEDRIRARALSLWPGEALYGVAESDWPAAFLGGGGEAAADEQLQWLAGWTVAMTVAIQRWGRDPVRWGRVLDVRQGRLRVAIPWYRQWFFDRALKVTLQLITDSLRSDPATNPRDPSWLGWLKADRGSEPDTTPDTTPEATLDRYFDGEWPDIQASGMAPNTLRFIEAAVRRGMPVDVLPSFVQIGWGVNAKRFDMATTGQTSWIGKTTARNKLKASQTLAAEGVPVPAARLVANVEQAQQAADHFGWPVVVKPLNQDGGRGVVPGVRDPAVLRRAFAAADRLSPGNVLVERHCAGEDYRVLVVHGRVLQVARRRSAEVTGDGVRTVRSLVDQLNDDPRRGAQRYSLLRVVSLDDDDVLACLADEGLTPDAVPPEGSAVRLSRVANISAGGTAEDVTGIVHPDNIGLAKRAARIVGLDIAGIDFLCPDITRSWREVGGVICEVNAQPGFRPHWLADPTRDLNGEVLDILFAGQPARIPTAAITGTNGKTTTAEMLYRIWMAAGRLTGVCTTARLRIGGDTVSTANLSGQPGTRMILNDPAVEAAVLEMPRKGLMLFGHHCDRYDVAALLNVQDDHIGVDGIETIGQMAELKAEVLERATEAVVINAEDPLCLAMRARAGTSRHILVARKPDAEAVVEHRRQGGEAVFLDQRRGQPWIVLAAGPVITELMPVHDIPATLRGMLPFNETNALFAAALAWAQGVDIDVIRRALSSFQNSPDHNPGRYNFLEGLPFDVLVDFAHNPDGVRGVCSVASALPVTGRRLLCSLNVGNRHPDHFDALAPSLAAGFDEVVLGCDPREVAKCPEYAGDEPTRAMLDRSRRLLLEQGVDPDLITCEVDRLTAISVALGRAHPGDLVVLLADLDEARAVVDQWRRTRIPPNGENPS